MQAADKATVVCAVTRDGRPSWAQPPAPKICRINEDILANRLDKTVFRQADACALSVVDVVDNLRAAGVDQLGLLTDQKEPGKMESDSAAPAAK